MRNFDSPKSVDDACERMEKLVMDIDIIQLQLQDRNKKTDQGDRMSVSEYREWRGKATYALSCKINEYRFLRGWERKNSHVPTPLVRPSDKQDALLMEAYRVMRNLGFLLEWKNIDSENQEIIDRIQFYLIKNNFIE